MILEGFEIENWTCIKSIKVSGLPPTGVIVIKGPNRRGKSSIVQALRACLMDNASTTSALKSVYPRGTSAKPVVSVTFKAEGTTYRIRKCFGTNKSELSSQTSAGAWKVETTSPADAHDRTCRLVGGDDSYKGLNQLLWLTQAEFRLPDPKKFDLTVQAQLRGLLGVLQTPLDDQFIERVKKRWNLWFSGQRKAGKSSSLKDNCNLSVNLKRLESVRLELQQSEGQFNETETLLKQATGLELRKIDLVGQLISKTDELQNCREEQKHSQSRIAARKLAEERFEKAENERDAALKEKRLREEALERWREDDRVIEPANKTVELFQEKVRVASGELERLRSSHSANRNHRRELQEHSDRVAAKLRSLGFQDKLNVAQREFDTVNELAQDMARMEVYLTDHPIPSESVLQSIKSNWQVASGLRAELEAASMNLTLVPEGATTSTQLALDGESIRSLPLDGGPTTYAVRRKADVVIQGWGRVELSRGIESRGIDQIEDELRRCKEELARDINPLGFSAADSRALDRVVDRVAEHRQHNRDLENKKKELKKLAPKGLEWLRARLVEMQSLASGTPEADAADLSSLPADQNELETLANTLKQKLGAKDEEIGSIEVDQETAANYLRTIQNEETTAKEALAAARAKVERSHAELGRLRTAEQIAHRVEEANHTIENAQEQLKLTELTPNEATIEVRLFAVTEAVTALGTEVRENEEKYNRIKGRLEGTEGLHARRASLAARFDEINQLVESESLQKDAIDRLYEVFDECRDKQLGTLMGPIHDRVLNWMRVLDIGDYKEMQFNNSFLPDRLLTNDGTAVFEVQEESTGAQELIGMLVRLSLGSLLSSAENPVVAILDDPLTHCDSGRLNKMRVILRRLAEGDPTLIPAAGRLQIVILTCHPEWFRDERATVIDLEDADVMVRF